MGADSEAVVHPEIPLVDAHVHMRQSGLYDSICASMAAAACRRMNIIATATREGAGDPNQILLEYKRLDPDRFYAFGAPDYRGPNGEAFDPAATSSADRQALARRLGEQPARLKTQGFDGIKLIESKPTSRRVLPFPLDSDVYAPFFAAVDELRFPLLWHVGDPPDFWDPAKIHQWARERGWLYDRSTDPSLETMRREAENVLARHPQLNVIFAHFYFLGNDLPRARKMFETYPNVRFDTTPGGQMYKFFNDAWDESRRFFIEFQDRLVFGTDLATTRESGRWPAEGAVNSWRTLRAYFGSGDVMPEGGPGKRFLKPGEQVRGLNLPEETLAKLFHKNFESAVSKTPARAA